MMMLPHMNTALRRHWKLGAATFACSLVTLLAVFALALPRLSPEAETTLAGPLRAHLPPLLLARLLSASAPIKRDEALLSSETIPTSPVALKPQTASPTGRFSASQEADFAELSRLDAKLRASKQREKELDAEIKRFTREQKQSKHDIVAATRAPALVVQPLQASPEVASVRQKIEQAKAKLATLSAYDTDQHPDVVAAKEELLTLESRLQQLEIERWDRREPAPRPTVADAQAADEKIVDVDSRVLDTLIAARAAVEEQIAAGRQRDRDALRTIIRNEGQRGELPPVLVEETPAPHPPHVDVSLLGSSPPRLTWIGGLTLGSPIAFLLALFVAMSAMLIAEYAQVRVQTAAFRDSSLHPSS